MFEYKGSLLDSISIAEGLAGNHQLNLSDDILLGEAIIVLPMYYAPSLSDSFSISENLEILTETKRSLADSILLADSSNNYQYAFPGIKLMAACHGGI